MSPTTNITDDHSVSFGMGDITLGDKTAAQGDGAVAVGGSTHGDIVSGDGAVLGNGNTVNNGDIHTGSGSTVTVGDGNAISEGNTSAGGDVLSSHDGTVIQTSGHGTTTVSDGNTTAFTEIRPSLTSTARATRAPSTTAARLPTRRPSTTPSTIHRCTRRRSWTPRCTTTLCTTTRARQLCARHVAARQFDPRDNAHRHRPGRAPRLLTRDSAASEWWWFVVGGEPGLALSFFFGDEFGSFASFGVDAFASVLLAGLFAARHQCRPVGVGLV